MAVVIYPYDFQQYGLDLAVNGSPCTHSGSGAGLKEQERAVAWRKLQHASALAERDGEIEGLRQEMRALKARMDSLAPPGGK